MAAALSLAVRSRKPMLIACRTLPGFAAPEKAGAGPSGWTREPFDLPDDLAERWRAVGGRGAAARRAWLKRISRHPLRAQFERATAGRLPDGWHEALGSVKAALAEGRAAMPTRQASQRALDSLLPAIPDLVGGGASAGGGLPAVTPGSYAGRYVQYGPREHAMGACANGLALHGGLLPFAGSPMASSDYMRPAIRLACLMGLRVVHVLTHDGVGAGGDGPAHQPVEHLAAYRAMPGLHLFRPADAVETVECWELALRRTDGPSVLALSGKAVPALRTDVAENRCVRGAYVLAEADGPRRATLVASGSEVALALAARDLLATEGVTVAVVSLPCWELFAAADDAYAAGVLGSAPRFGIEAACGFGWERWLGADCIRDGAFIGPSGFGASAPAAELYKHFGLTPEAIAAAVRKRLPQ